ncbi:MAG: RNA polymerase sigma factor RpoD/SigA [Bacteroidia bacterium]|nr:RNA polymerase sigma factor RpoD/SigA [Bacteroidia bacterium]
MRQLKITHNITNRDSYSIEKYLSDISKEQLINPEEEARLAKAIREGDSDALEKLVRANLRFVVSVAKQYQNQGLSLNDLINEGNLGLIRAANKFDESKGFKFISYAVWWIRQAILQALVEQSKVVRIPLNKAGNYSKIQRALNDFELRFQREPSTEELAEILNLKQSEIVDFVRNNKKTVSTDDPIDADKEFTVLDTIKQDLNERPDNSLLEDSMKQELEEALSIFTEREIAILTAYFGLDGSTPMTLEDIGDNFDLTRERVRQIKAKCLKKLKKLSISGDLASYLS